MSCVRLQGNKYDIDNFIVKLGGEKYYISTGLIKQDGEKMLFWKREQTYTINSSDILLNVDLFLLFGSPKVKGIFTLVNNGVIGSSNNKNPSLQIKDFPSGSIINIVNNGYIIGKGGNGNDYPTAGDDGGNAIVISSPCNITNNNIIGGGGGGGCSAYGQYQYASGKATGGGGAGWEIGTSGGTTKATKTTGGTGQTTPVYRASITAGTGGALGEDGKKGVAGAFVTPTFSAVGKAGKAIINNGSVGSVLTNKGNVYGVSDI